MASTPGTNSPSRSPESARSPESDSTGSTHPGSTHPGPTPPTHPICFLLDDQVVRTEQPAGRLVLDFVRRSGRTGTKEGCREGDCGACTLLVGDLDSTGNEPTIRYRPMTSCLMPLGEAHGRHLVTIDGLSVGGPLPVHREVASHGGSQCGFCTPGIVVSLVGMILEGRPDLDADGVRRALSGHLCRCTGYRSLVDAGLAIANGVPGQDAEGELIPALAEAGWLPPFLAESPAQLAALRATLTPPDEGSVGLRIAGGTDLYVQQHDIPTQPVEVLGQRDALRGIRRQNGHLRLGALTSFEELVDNPQVLQLIPEMPAIQHRIASWQVRTRATLGGNLVNASPIGDMTILLLALDAELVLRRGDESRTQPLRTFYQGYKTIDLADDEILAEILVPIFDRDTRIGFEKTSKRACLDIATVNSAVAIRPQEGLIAEARLAVGGVAPIPLRLEGVGQWLRGQPVAVATVEEACRRAQGEIAPISDVRGHADYKRLLVRQHLIAHFCRLFPEQLEARDLHGV